MPVNSDTLLLWGAGATASLGMRTTFKQSQYLEILACGTKDKTPIQPLIERVTNALDETNRKLRKTDQNWISALADLLLILGDGNDVNQFARITSDQISAMRRNWRNQAVDEELRYRILDLRMLYDWVALKSVINLVNSEADSNQTGTNSLTDIINILDLHSLSGHGFRLQENELLTPNRVIGARNALKLLLLTMFFIDWQTLLSDPQKRPNLEIYYDFVLALARRMQRNGIRLANEYDHQCQEFYLDDIKFASLNFDPIILWLQWIANRDLNKSLSVPHIGSLVFRLQLFHDLGHLVPMVRIGGEHPGQPRLTMSESGVQRINDPEHGATDRIRIRKFLFPHGCLNWRECPNCGKLSSFMSDKWRMDSPTLFPLPPLRAFSEHIKPRLRLQKEHDEFDRGAVDARACVHCNELTYYHHTQITLQSNFKTPPPPYIEEIKRELRVVVQNSDHIIFMGYSLPPDDVEYRAFFAARRQRNSSKKVNCSVVVGQNSNYHCWLMPADLSDVSALDLPHHNQQTLHAAQGLFGRENVRFYGGGIPQVFSDKETVTDAAIDRLLRWNSTE